MNFKRVSLFTTLCSAVILTSQAESLSNASGLSSQQESISVFYVPLESGEISSNPVLEYEQPESLTPTYNANIKLYPDIKFQQIGGIGGCFNEIGGEALASLSDDQQQLLLNALFDVNSGSAFSFCRAAIGSSDFGIDAYSFSEVSDDYDMKHFSLDRDKRYMLPYMQKAFAINPDIRLFGSPWSPPAWMKHSKYMDRGSEFPDKNFLIDDPKIYDAYAKYMLKYVEEYAKEGVNVERIVIQNEQDFHTKYPSCRMPVEQMSKFVSGYLKPLFDKKGVDTEIWAGTFRTAGEVEGVKFASDTALQYGFEGMAVQYTRPAYLTDIKLLAPNMNIMHSESNCFNGLNNDTQSRSRFEEVASYINGGCENFCYWNMILNETGESGWNWRQNALVTINRETKEVIYNPDYAVMSLMSRYIKPNSVRIASFCQKPIISIELDGQYYLILQNDNDKPVCYNCSIDNGVSYYFEIPAQSLCAVVIPMCN